MVGEQLSVLDMLQLYIGNASLMLLFVLALIYLWAREKRRGYKTVLVYSSVCVLGIFLFPPFLKLFQRFGEGEIYYRLLWLLPIGIVIPYATATVFAACKKKWLGYCIVLLVSAYVIIGGNCVYNAPQLSRAQNAYQLPQEVVDICDVIVVPGREVKAAFPHELVQYVRQYTPYVILTFGYDSIVERWGMYDAMEEEMRREISSASQLAAVARESNTHYIVLNKNHLVEGNLEDNGFHMVYETENYKVYLDENADLSL